MKRHEVSCPDHKRAKNKVGVMPNEELVLACWLLFIDTKETINTTNDQGLEAKHYDIMTS